MSEQQLRLRCRSNLLLCHMCIFPDVVMSLVRKHVVVEQLV